MLVGRLTRDTIRKQIVSPTTIDFSFVRPQSGLDVMDSRNQLRMNNGILVASIHV
jgi:hypothetical protein